MVQNLKCMTLKSGRKLNDIYGIPLSPFSMCWCWLGEILACWKTLFGVSVRIPLLAKFIRNWKGRPSKLAGGIPKLGGRGEWKIIGGGGMTLPRKLWPHIRYTPPTSDQENSLSVLQYPTSRYSEFCKKKLVSDNRASAWFLKYS